MLLDRLLGHQDEPRTLGDLAGRRLNYDPERLSDLVCDGRGNEDELRCQIGCETPGEPVAGGIWETARRIVQDYAFAEGSAVDAIFDRTAPLSGREMLLRAAFKGLHFNMGVRVGDVRDEVVDVGGRPARVWGWAYGTLEGHLERGRMDYEVWKWMDTGQVDLRLTAVSRRADIRNPIVRLGFRLFGRREQMRFHRHACTRVAELTSARVARDRAGRV